MRLICCLSLLLLPVVAASVVADQPTTLQSGSHAKRSVESSLLPAEGRSVTDVRLTDAKADAEDEADAATLAFVREHQPELAKLLQFLKSKRRSDYDDALKEIRRVRERLENLKKRDRELHDVELALWKNSAQLRLWAASVSASSKKLDDADRRQLTELVTRENELMTERLTLEKARAQARIEQLNQQLSKRKDQSESLIAKGIKAWESRIERPSNKGKTKTPAGEIKNTLDRS